MPDWLEPAAEWLFAQQPGVIAAVAFVAGGVFTAVVDLAGRELSAWIEERRRRARERRESLLKRLDLTQRYIWAFEKATVNRLLGNEDYEFTADAFIGGRMTLIGDIELVKRLDAVLHPLVARPDHKGITWDEYVELVAAREACSDALERQEDRVTRGKRITEIDRDVVDKVWSMAAVTKAARGDDWVGYRAPREA